MYYRDYVKLVDTDRIGLIRNYTDYTYDVLLSFTTFVDLFQTPSQVMIIVTVLIGAEVFLFTST